MLNKLRSFVKRYGLILPGDRVTVALSGGKDSVALLFALYLLKDEWSISLEAAHFNHHLRSEESDRDECFVGDLCGRFDIPLTVGEEWVKPGEKGLEAAAREARYAFFRALPGKIATAHTADDNAETVLLRSREGLTLVGHFRKCENAERILIAFHGWRSAWYRDFGLLSEFWEKEKCSVLYVEQRAQNESEGAYIGFGLTERYDCLDWARWVMDHCGSDLPIYLTGVSMGATSVLMAAGMGLPDAVRGVIADSAYTSPQDIWQYVMGHNLHLPTLLATPIADGICKKRLAAGAGSCSTLVSLAETDVPVLLIHGEDDHFVPLKMARANLAACHSPCELLVVPGADHAMSYYMDKDTYEEATRRFWQRCESAESGTR